MQTFKETALEPIWITALEKQGIIKPTPIQSQCIDPGLEGKDVIGEAQTGTGKTLAFLLPIFQQIDSDAIGVQALILVPTRELAIQITDEAKKLSEFKKLRILSAYGGQDIVAQVKKLKNNVQLVVATPGRLLDHLRRETIQLKTLKHLVLDEVDQMLHLGFQRDVEMVLKHLPDDYQCLFFSATLNAQVRKLAGKYTEAPMHFRVEKEEMSLKNIRQGVIETTDRKKQEDLIKLLEREHPFMSIIFCRTKRRVTALFEAMEAKGYNCAELHGDLPQSKREKTIKSFRNLELQYLIATDVAARGLDIDGITHVINYDTPEDAESYIHRIGRTGRAGQKGNSFTLVVGKNKNDLKAIEALLGHVIPKEVFSLPSHDSSPQKGNREKESKTYSDKKNESIARSKRASAGGKSGFSSSKRGPAGTDSKPRKRDSESIPGRGKKR